MRSFLYPHSRLKRYIAIQQHFREAWPSGPFYSCVFDRATSRFCWAISKDDILIYGGVFEPNGCREAFEAQKQRLPKPDFDLRTPICTEACAVLRPEGTRQFCLGHDDAFLIGEAAGFISPTSFEGISWAITSAALLPMLWLRARKRRETLPNSHAFPARQAVSQAGQGAVYVQPGAAQPHPAQRTARREAPNADVR